MNVPSVPLPRTDHVGVINVLTGGCRSFRGGTLSLADKAGTAFFLRREGKANVEEAEEEEEKEKEDVREGGWPLTRIITSLF